MSTYRLPFSQQSTTSLRRYLSEWKKLMRPLEKKLGVQCTAFDPDIQIEDGAGHRITLPLWLVDRIIGP